MTIKTHGRMVTDNSISITQLNVTDGSDGQVLSTDGSGTMSFESTAVLVIEDNSVTGAKIAMSNDVAGDVLYYNGTDYQRLGIGTSGQHLATNSGANAPEWATPTAHATSATATAEGLVEIATQAEVTTGTDTARSITPATLAGANFLSGAASVAQGNLKTTTQDNVSAYGSVINTFIHAGGEYVLGRQYKATSTIAGFTAVFSDAERHFHSTTDIGGTLSSGLTLTTTFTTAQTMFAWSHTSGGGPTVTARSRYIQASPPYDIGDGHIHTFIYLLIENGTGKILESLHAPDPTWANNGPTDIRPEYEKDGKLYKHIKRFDKTKEYSDPDCITNTLEEITLDYKNSDMDLFPHPYVGNNMEGKSVVLIDPCSDIALRIEELKEVGETPLMDLLMETDYIRFGNEHIEGRCTPCDHGVDEVMVVKPTWKNSK